MKQQEDEALTEGAEALREQIYQRLRDDLRSGKFAPGEKITIRQIAARERTSPTPVREALYRLVAEGTLVAEANRSTRVPLLTGADIRELRTIRAAVESLAAAKVAEVCDASLIANLRSIAVKLYEARAKGDVEADLRCVYEFQSALYQGCGMPTLIRIIEGLWLTTGPYMTLMYPDYIQRVTLHHGDWRERICIALERHDVAAVQAEIDRDVREALTYLAGIVDASHLQSARSGRRR